MRNVVKNVLIKRANLLPIMNPLFNLREITKQLSLLEDHLNHPRKRCPDCIRKHFLTIEALFEEAVSLDKDLQYSDLLYNKAESMRVLQGFWLDSLNQPNEHKRYLILAQTLRKFRKEFAPLCFDVRKMASLEQSVRKYFCKCSTLNHVEKEDREAQKLVKRSPKKKPPRKDLMKKRVKVEDPDLENLGGGAGGDRDLSMNHRRV